MNFKPIIGKTYHLYEKKSGKKFMSLISPLEWRKNKDLLFWVVLNKIQTRGGLKLNPRYFLNAIKKLVYILF